VSRRNFSSRSRIERVEEYAIECSVLKVVWRYKIVLMKIQILEEWILRGYTDGKRLERCKNCSYFYEGTKSTECYL
jgi:hypothetical protein